MLNWQGLAVSLEAESPVSEAGVENSDLIPCSSKTRLRRREAVKKKAQVIGTTGKTPTILRSRDKRYRNSVRNRER